MSVPPATQLNDGATTWHGVRYFVLQIYEIKKTEMLLSRQKYKTSNGNVIQFCIINFRIFFYAKLVSERT